MFATASAYHKGFELQVIFFFKVKEHKEEMIDREMGLKKTNQTRQSIRTCLTTDRCVEMNPTKPSVLAAAFANYPDAAWEESSFNNLACRFFASQRTKSKSGLLR